MTALFKASGLITLTTDFGVSDPYAGVMKGAILGRCADARLIDLTHDIPAYQPQLAGFWLARSWRYFPEGTVHLAVVDPGVGTERAMALAIGAGQVFVAPDNGLLDAVIDSLPAPQVRVFGLDDLQELQLPRPSFTFHGRDIFAPLVAEIAANRLMPNWLGLASERRIASSEKPAAEGQVIWIDHYGNLITNLRAAALSAFQQPLLRYRERLINIYPSYGYAAYGELMALINAWGVLEIAQSQGHAQQFLLATVGESVCLLEGVQ